MSDSATSHQSDMDLDAQIAEQTALLRRLQHEKVQSRNGSSRLNTLDLSSIHTYESFDVRQLSSESSPSLRTSTPKSARRSLNVPPECQTACRKVIRMLMADESNPLMFQFTNFSADEDSVVRVAREVHRFYKDQAWSYGTIQEGVKKVWKNMRDDNHREASGKKEEHRNQGRLNKRINTKVKRRRQALSCVQWTEEVKRETEFVLQKNFTSPEKDGVDGVRWRLPFAWESSRLSKRKLELDRVYTTEILKPVQQLRLGQVVDHPTDYVQTPPPEGTPAWAVSKKYK